MKFLSVIFLSCAALAFAQDSQTQAAKNPAPATAPDKPPVYKRLGAVTWDPQSHKLQWTVETGNLVEGRFVSKSTDRYEISPDEATMATAQETRGFDDNEAAGLHRLLNILTVYCAQSVDWWNDGAGKPVETKPSDDDKPAGKPVKVKDPVAPKPAPVRIAPGQAIAELPGVH